MQPTDVVPDPEIDTNVDRRDLDADADIDSDTDDIGTHTDDIDPHPVNTDTDTVNTNTVDTDALDTHTDPHLLTPLHILPRLQCPACNPTTTLVAPTTLQCGHTVCAHHLRNLPHSTPSPTLLDIPSCPLPTCIPAPHAASIRMPNIPTSSSVQYYPSPLSLGASPPARVPEPRLDVTVSKVLAVVSTAQARQQDDLEFVHQLQTDDEQTDDEDQFPSAVSIPLSPRLFTPTPGASAQQNDIPHSHSRPSSLSSPPRPRKRKRRHVPDTTLHAGPSQPYLPSDRFSKELQAELTCEICFMLLYQPVTTLCQHTFCAKCIRRSLDHSLKCPICRHDIPEFSYAQDHAYNRVLLSIILQTYPDIYNERKEAIEEEERGARLNTPIFVCQLSFPGMPTLLHFFEPRYRLMLRRCLESPTPHFGMIMPPHTTPNGAESQGNDYGTILEIRSVQMLPDGRSMVETWGTHRFRIIERGSLDGYMVGRIERIDDFPSDLEEEAELSMTAAPQPSHLSAPLSVASSSLSSSSSSSLSPSAPPLNRRSNPTNDELMAVCHAFLDQLRNGTAPWVVQRLNNAYGPMPADPCNFSFWMALVLPIDEHEKAKLLPIKSPRLRLRLVVHWIEQLNDNWWFSSGCIVS